jgi:hypothetical protein
MSYLDALSRISQIQEQLAELSAGTTPASIAAATGGASGAAASDSGSTSFADALSQAQDPSAVATGGELSTSASSGVASGGLPAATGLGSLSGVTGGAGLAAPASLPAAASSMLTSSQQQFASRLVADTGLNPAVVCAWMLSEENGGAAQARQAAGNNDWLNIGYTNAGVHGSSDSIWSDPATAADATAGWLEGQYSIPGFGTASAGIQAILASVGQSPGAQIAALQSSGWASGGYPSLPSLYARLAG